MFSLGDVIKILLLRALTSNHCISCLVFSEGMTEEEILGNSILFFIAGYETTASTLNFLSFLLATHQDAQDKLLQEVDSVVGKVRFFLSLD